jgi:hypothetical protein
MKMKPTASQIAMDGPIQIHKVSDGTKSRLGEFPRLSSFEDVVKLTEITTKGSSWDLLSCSSTRSRRAPRLSERSLTERRPTFRISIPPTIPPLELSESIMVPQVEARPYSWPIDGGFNPRTTALVIVDMQKDCEFSTPSQRVKAFILNSRIWYQTSFRMLRCETQIRI